ncbi:MAG: hypothetical protein JWN44_3056 [Myxococcales bacterium]|nr:hypothetical protein [Myxococcales bacterium]
MPAKTPSKGKKAAAPKAPKKTVPPKVAKKPPVEDDEVAAADEGDDDDDDLDDDLDDDEEESPRPAAKPAAATAAAPVKKPAAPAPAAAKPRFGQLSEDAPAVVPARRLTPEAKARVNEMVRKGMSLGDALKAAAAWETFVAPVKDEPAKLVQGRTGGGGAEAGPRSNFAGETEPEDLHEGHDEEEPVATED